jgi:hypothetical protein
MNKNDAEDTERNLAWNRKAAKTCLELAGVPSDEPELESIIEDAARTKPDDFFEMNGDEDAARFLLGEDDADAIAGKNAVLVQPLRKLARCVLLLRDCEKLLVALAVMRKMSAKRRTSKFDDAACDLLKRWGGVDAAAVDALPSLLVGKLFWRICVTHSAEGDVSTLEAAERDKNAARMKWQGKTWEEIGKVMGTNEGAAKVAWHRRQERLG